jgi:hypothetical protein
MSFTYTDNGDGTATITGYSVTVPATLAIPSTIGPSLSVTIIGESAFLNATGLTTLTLPSSLTFVGWNAFQSCTSLNNLTLPSSLTIVGSDAFNGCTSLATITFSSGTVIADSDAFLDCPIATATFLPGITSITTGALVGKTTLTSVTLPTSGLLSLIGTFGGCTNLASITLPNSITTIGAGTFSSCTSLASITLPNSITTIGSNAFLSCTSLNNLTLPSSLTSVGDETFQGCTSLATITFGSGTFTVGTDAFVDCPIATATFLPGITSITIGALVGKTTLTSVTLPTSGLLSLTGTFNGCTNLASITLPNSITTIGDNTFFSCTSLTSITLPYNLTTLGNSVFENCTSLATIEFLGSRPPTIGTDIFNGASATFASVPCGWTTDPIDSLPVVINGGGACGDPYVTTVHGRRYKLPTADVPIRFYQGLVDGKLLTVNAQLRTTPNEALFAENMRSYLKHKDTMPKDKLKYLERALRSTEKLCFFEKFYIQYGDTEILLNVWDHKFKFESYKGKVASSVVDGNRLTNTYSDIYKNYINQTLKFAIGDSGAVYVSVYPGTMLKNGIFIEAPGLAKGNGVLVNVLNSTQMTLSSLTSLNPVVKKDAVLKEKEEWFLDHDGYRTRTLRCA